MELSKKEILVLLGGLYNLREEQFGIQVDEQTMKFLDEQTRKVFGGYVYEEEFADTVLEAVNKNIDFLLAKLQDDSIDLQTKHSLTIRR